MLPEGKCRYIDGQIYPDGNFYVLDTEHIKHNGNELKSALNTIDTDVSNKVDKVSGKGLSTEDYTTAEKNKLSGIADDANNYVHPTTSGNKHIPSGGSSGKILGWSADGEAAWVDPSGGGGGGGSVETVFIDSTEYAPDANGKVTLPAYPTSLPASDVYSWAKAATKPTYTYSEVGAAASSHTHSGYVPTSRTVNGYDLSSNVSLDYSDVGAASSGHSHSNATTSTSGFMSYSDKSKLNGIDNNANYYTHPTGAGNKHIPSGGSSGDILAYSSSGTAAWTGGYIKQTEVTLSDNSNLNNYTSADTVWLCLSSASASSISNTPWTGGGFKVWNEAIVSKSAIKSGSGGLFYQCLTPNNADGTLIYRRKYDGGTWGSWYKFVNASSSTFAITRYSSTYTVSAYDSYKCNGIATFTVTITSSSSISANTSIPIAYVASDTVPKGSSSCYYRFVAHADNTIAQGYIKGGNRTLYIKTPTSIPANTNIFITGTYAY